MEKKRIGESELVLNPDGSQYHIHLRAEHIAPTVLLVGDPGRVKIVSKYFDAIEFESENREFVCHTGKVGQTRLTVLSTGIGTDNIDIVVNELDAAINIDPDTRLVRDKIESLQLIRLGTTGALHPDLMTDTLLISEYAIGFDGLLYYYDHSQTNEEKILQREINEHLLWDDRLSVPYVVKASENIVNLLQEGMAKGITATATGFYGPQGRAIRLDLNRTDINEKMMSFNWEGHRITNFEMETSALYALGKGLGHECCTCCVILANRVRQEYSSNNKLAVKKMIETVLERLSS
jgi:uridine phosphorylase